MARRCPSRRLWTPRPRGEWGCRVGQIPTRRGCRPAALLTRPPRGSAAATPAGATRVWRATRRHPSRQGLPPRRDASRSGGRRGDGCGSTRAVCRPRWAGTPRADGVRTHRGACVARQPTRAAVLDGGGGPPRKTPRATSPRAPEVATTAAPVEGSPRWGPVRGGAAAASARHPSEAASRLRH